MKRIPLVVLLVALSSFSSCDPFGGDVEYYYETYEDLEQSWGNLELYLPKTSRSIRHYAVLDMDTNYHFFEAVAEIKELSEFIASNNNFDSKLDCSQVNYSDERFDRLFYKRSVWWNQESLGSYESNHLLVFEDDNHYGGGVWLFYNSNTSQIRVFKWSQQWLSSEDVEKALIQD